MKTIKNLEELNLTELKSINGGGAAEMVGLGIASGLAFAVAGFPGMLWAYYNFFKD